MSQTRSATKAAAAAAASVSEANAAAATSEEDIIQLEEGWKHCRDTGVQPFITRIETAFDANEFERCTIKAGTYMEVYDKVFKMCIQRDPYNHSEALYVHYTSSIRSYLCDIVSTALSEARASNEISFLREWTKRWKYQQILVRGLAGMFTYLDRFYVPNAENKRTLSEQGFHEFRVQLYDKFNEFAKSAILTAIRKERELEEQDADLLRSSVNVFVELGYRLPPTDLSLYEEHLEAPLLEASRSHYRQQSREWLEEDNCPEYLLKAEDALGKELARIEAYLHPSSTPKLMDACRTEILQEHQLQLMSKHSGIDNLLQTGAQKDLSRLYRLYKEVDGGIKEISKALRGHVRKIGIDYIEQSKSEGKEPDAKSQGKDEHKLVKRLIQLHEQYQAIVKGCFCGDTVVEKALREAFEDCINREYYTASLLARFVNALLSKGSKLSVQALEQTLDHVVMLYGYIRDKDVFEEEYQTYLANRLLYSKSESHQAEKTMIAKLKSECGYHWTSKLEAMFKDVTLSDELLQQFFSQFGGEFESELRVNICTMGRWPSASLPSCTMPSELRTLTDKFRMYYVNKHSGKRLEWQMDKGEADVLVRFGSNATNARRTPTLLVTTSFQMVVLLLYNHGDEFTFSSILQQTNIPREELEVHLLSLAHPKVKVLLKNPNTREVKDEHTFALNQNYASKLFRVKVPLMKAPTKKKVGVDPKIQTQRRHQIDAAIVRIMKTRQRLHHNPLLAEVIKQLQRFKPTAADIKKRIEHLIEQEYLERDETDRRIYNYLA